MCIHYHYPETFFSETHSSLTNGQIQKVVILFEIDVEMHRGIEKVHPLQVPISAFEYSLIFLKFSLTKVQDPKIASGPRKFWGNATILTKSSKTDSYTWKRIEGSRKLHPFQVLISASGYESVTIRVGEN